MKDAILSRLSNVKGNGTKYRAKCPARDHSSGNSTLSLLFNDDGRILIHCHGGCEANDILESIGLTLSDLYPDGAIRDFMASAAPKKKESKYDSWLWLLERQKGKLQPGERFTESTLAMAREMYRKSKNVR